MNLFNDIKGQDKVIKTLASQIKNRQLSHSYLFVGISGSGKEFMARSLAKYILCGSQKEDECLSCKKFEKSIHPDFFIIDGSERIKIEQIREVVEKINLTPSLSNKKVLLITKAENMGIEASNSLLKTLEEPPADSVIMITALSEKTLPETIVSRCQVFRTKRITDKQIESMLIEKYDQKLIKKVISLSAGSIGKALRLSDDKEMLEREEKIYNDAVFLISDNLISEKFKIIDEYDKSKNIKIIFFAIKSLIQKSIIIMDAESSFGIAPERAKRFANKILKIYSNLDYNISLRIALEEMILEDSLNA